LSQIEQSQQELVQTNKLGGVGQISAIQCWTGMELGEGKLDKSSILRTTQLDRNNLAGCVSEFVANREITTTIHTPHTNVQTDTGCRAETLQQSQ